MKKEMREREFIFGLSYHNKNNNNNNFVFPLLSAQVPDSDEQFVPDFHSENCE